MSAAKRKRLEARLDGRQKLAALALVEREFAGEAERITLESIAESVGVSTKTLYEWRTRNKTFIDYVNTIADDFLASKRPVVYRRLMQLIDSPQPSVKGIDLYFKREGLVTAHTVVETKDGGADAKSNEDIAKDIDELDELLSEGETE